MSAIENRVSRLEQSFGTGQKRQVIVSARSASEADIDAFLKAKGIVLDHQRDQLVVLSTEYEKRDGTVDVEPPEIVLVHVGDLKG